MNAPAPLRGARAALIFLTRIPVGGFPFSPADWQWSSAHFPFAGAVVGAFMAGTFWLAKGAGALVAGTLAVAVGMLVTGAFHEDGLADSADALGGAFDRDKLFVILKDSRVGSFGAGALAIVLLLRVALLARLDALAPCALLVVQCAARVPPIWLMGAMPYVSADEHAKSRTVARARPAQVAVATLWGAAAVALGVRFGGLLPPDALWMGVAGLAVAVVCGWRFHVRAGGITGDFLGATEQVADCAMMLALALVHAP